MRIKQPVMRRARIEIIPMIDTIFFLLVFFMITWLTMIKMNGLSLNMPRPTPSIFSAPPVSVTLSLTPDGHYFLNSEPATAQNWPAHLRERLQTHATGVVVVNVASDEKTQTLISMLDTVNHAITDAHSNAQVLVRTPRVVPRQESSRGTRVDSIAPSGKESSDATR